LSGLVSVSSLESHAAADRITETFVGRNSIIDLGGASLTGRATATTGAPMANATIDSASAAGAVSATDMRVIATIGDFASVIGLEDGPDRLKLDSGGLSYQTGEAVVYTASDSAIEGLVSGRTYYVIYDEAGFVQLATSFENAEHGIAINLTAAIPDPLPPGTHTLSRTDVASRTRAYVDENTTVKSTGDVILAATSNTTVSADVYNIGLAASRLSPRPLSQPRRITTPKSSLPTTST